MFMEECIQKSLGPTLCKCSSVMHVAIRIPLFSLHGVAKVLLHAYFVSLVIMVWDAITRMPGSGSIGV